MQLYWFKFAKKLLDSISCFLHKVEGVWVCVCACLGAPSAVLLFMSESQFIRPYHNVY